MLDAALLLSLFGFGWCARRAVYGRAVRPTGRVEWSARQWGIALGFAALPVSWILGICFLASVREALAAHWGDRAPGGSLVYGFAALVALIYGISPRLPTEDPDAPLA